MDSAGAGKDSARAVAVGRIEKVGVEVEVDDDMGVAVRVMKIVDGSFSIDEGADDPDRVSVGSEEIVGIGVVKVTSVEDFIMGVAGGGAAAITGVFDEGDGRGRRLAIEVDVGKFRTLGEGDTTLLGRCLTSIGICTGTSFSKIGGELPPPREVESKCSWDRPMA